MNALILAAIFTAAPGDYMQPSDVYAVRDGDGRYEATVQVNVTAALLEFSSPGDTLDCRIESAGNVYEGGSVSMTDWGQTQVPEPVNLTFVVRIDIDGEALLICDTEYGAYNNLTRMYLRRLW